MNGGIWFDLVLVSLLVLMGFLAWNLRRAEARSDANESFSDSLKVQPEKKRWSPYPSNIIRQCGFSPEQAKWVYWPFKLALAVGFPMIVVELTAGKAELGWLLGLSLAGFFTPDLYLLLRRKNRRHVIGNSLGFFVSLLVIYIKSGMSLTRAFDHAAKYGLTEANPLRKEVDLLVEEIAAGRERDEAFACLAQRTGVEELQRLAAVMAVGFSVGSPLAQTLDAQADLLRAKQRQLGTQLANRKTMEAMLPMILVCFPMFLVLVFYPAGSQVIEVFTLLKELF